MLLKRQYNNGKMDEILNKYMFISLIFIVNLHCASTLTIDEQIAIIKKAPESERVELMNQFKRQLILMNQQERLDAIAQLKKDQNSMEKSFERESKDFVNGLQSSRIEQHIQVSRRIELEHKLRERMIPTDVEPSVPTDVEPSVPSDVEPSVPSDVEPSVPSDVEPSVPSDVEPSVPSDAEPSVPSDAEPSIPSDAEPSIPTDAEPSVPTDAQPLQGGGLQ